jgi:hypothetical protein
MYSEALLAREDPDHPDREMFEHILEASFDPDDFRAGEVRFTDPKERWKEVFS